MILSRYVAYLFLRALVIVATIFLIILFLIEMVEQVRRFSDESVSLATAAHLSLLNIMGSFYSILPLITNLAAISLFLGLARTSQLVAIRASGRSGLRIILAPAVTAALAGVLAVAILNPIVAATQKQYEQLVSRVESHWGEAISLGGTSVWLRQALRIPLPNGKEEIGQVVIRATRASADATTLYGTTFMLFTPEQGPIGRIDAKEARLEKGEWKLTDTKEWPLTAANPELAATTAPTRTIPTDLTADRIRDGFGRPDAVPIWQLPGFIRGIERAGFSAQRYRVWFQMELALPLMLAAMVVVAAVFTMGHTRGRKLGVAVLAAFASGLLLFFLRNMAEVLGNNGSIPPELVGLAPPLVAMFLALGVVLQLEDG